MALTQWALGLLFGVLGGAAGTAIAFRTRLAMLDRDMGDASTAHVDRKAIVDARLDAIERKQMLMLKLLADVARKVGVDGRLFDDALIRMLTEEQ